MRYNSLIIYQKKKMVIVLFLGMMVGSMALCALDDNSIPGDDGDKHGPLCHLYCIFPLLHRFHVLQAGKLRLTETKVTGLFYLLSGALP